MTARKSYQVVKLLITSTAVFTFCSCTTIHLTKPLCGPESFDHRPAASIPDAAVGCYEVSQQSAFSFNFSDNIFASSKSEPGYIWFAKDGGTQDIRASTNITLSKNLYLLGVRESDELKPLICELPVKGAKLNSRVLMTNDHGWYAIQEYTFEPDRAVLTINQYSTVPDKIKSSGLKYALFSNLNGDSSTQQKYPSDQIFGTEIDMILVDNSNLSPEETFERLALEKAPVGFEIKRVDSSLCNRSNMRRLF